MSLPRYYHLSYGEAKWGIAAIHCADYPYCGALDAPAYARPIWCSTIGAGYCGRFRKVILALERSEVASATRDQPHTSTLRPGTVEKCFRLLVMTVIPWETACEAMRRSMFPIGLPERSNSVRIRA
jgi:hypothetical protein